MKLTKHSGFKPISIMFETQDEINQVFAVTNHTGIIDRFGPGSSIRKIHELLREHKDSDYHRYHEILIPLIRI